MPVSDTSFYMCACTNCISNARNPNSLNRKEILFFSVHPRMGALKTSISHYKCYQRKNSLARDMELLPTNPTCRPCSIGAWQEFSLQGTFWPLPSVLKPPVGPSVQWQHSASGSWEQHIPRNNGLAVPKIPTCGKPRAGCFTGQARASCCPRPSQDWFMPGPGQNVGSRAALLFLLALGPHFV